ncbi:MAG: glyoxalase [Bacteroidia bacterium]
MIQSIRPFIGAKDYQVAQKFYQEIGFEPLELSHHLMVFKKENFAFYLQDAYVEDWVNNSMVFLELDELDTYHRQLKAKNLPAQFEGVKLSEIQIMPWGKVFYLHDPSSILWHIGTFNS